MPLPTPLAYSFLLSLGSVTVTGLTCFLIARLFGTCLVYLKLSKNELFGLLLFLALSAYLLFVPPYLASNLSVSDALEYSIAAHRYWFDGTYSIGIGTQSLPPRYPPTFSLVFLAPLYAAFGAEVGNSIFAVLLSALTSLALMYCLMALLIGNTVALIGCFLLFCLPEFRTLASLPMSDLPALMLLLAALLRAVFAHKANRISAKTHLEIGFYLGLALALRVSNIVLIVALLPYLRALAPSQRVRALAWAGLAPCLGLISIFLYQKYVFGDFFRSGYHFWVSIPYDFPELVFSSRYLLSNVHLLLTSASFVPLFFAGIVLLTLKRVALKSSPPSQPQTALSCSIHAIFFLACALALTYLPYFYCTRRFFLPLSALCIPWVLYHASSFMSIKQARLLKLLSLTLLFFACGIRFQSIPEIPARRLLAEQSRRTEQNAVIIAALDPAFAERFITRESERLFIPLTRKEEFASKILAVAPLSEGLGKPESWFPHRSKAALAAGAKDAVEWVAVEAPDKITALILTGRPVYVATSLAAEEDLYSLKSQFKWEAAAEGLSRLKLLN